MIILLINNDPTNRAVAEAIVKQKQGKATIHVYPNIIPEVITDDSITLLGVSGGEEFLRLVQSTRVVEKLKNAGLDKELKNFYFIISDTDSNNNLITFAKKLISTLSEQDGVLRHAYVTSDINFDKTQIEYSKAESGQSVWKVWGSREKFSETSTKRGFFKFAKSSNSQSKTLSIETLWTGEDIFDWLVHTPQHDFVSKQTLVK